MLLRHYLSDKRIKQKDFAQKIGISTKHLWTILNAADMKLSLALKIEEVTKGEVTCQDLGAEKRMVQFQKLRSEKSEDDYEED